jgi:hypothetical protein
MEFKANLWRRFKPKALELVLVELCGLLLSEQPARTAKFITAITRAIENEAVVRELDEEERTHLRALID